MDLFRELSAATGPPGRLDSTSQGWRDKPTGIVGAGGKLLWKGGLAVPIRGPPNSGGIRSWTDAFNSGDIEALMALYMPDAIYMAEPGRQVSGKEAIRATYQEFVSLKVPITLEMLDIAVVDDIAQTRGRWTMRGTSADGQSVDLGGTTADVLKRQPDGTWLLMIDCLVTNDRPCAGLVLSGARVGPAVVIRRK
jgi:uncharacterized protein (TIGR02246 family)